MTKPIHIPNIKNYTWEIINGELILTLKKQYITENELKSQITSSTIQECIIKKEDEIISTKKKYRSLLVDMWKYMPERHFQTSTFNFKKKNENGKKGYNWCDDIHRSFQDKNAKGAFAEIINMVKVNKFTINLSIKLITGGIVHFKID